MTKKTYRKNILKAWNCTGPEWIPIQSGISYSIWDTCDNEGLQDILCNHPLIWPFYNKGDMSKKKKLGSLQDDQKNSIKYKDAWGNVWETPEDGMVGVVTGHALSDLSEVDSLIIPDPEFTNGKLPWFWEEKKKTLLYMKEKEELTACHLSHGHTFLLLQDLLGYEKLIYAMADDDPNLWKLIKKVESFQMSLIEKFCSVKPDMIGIPEDLGMQNSPMISPSQFAKYIKPVYLKMTTMAKDQGICVHEHSDGYIMDLIDDLVECGGDVLNLQDLVNGIDNIEKYVKGRVVIDLDIDRQNITVFGTSKDIDNHIKECVMKLGSPKGGFTMIYQPWKPTPLENLRAVYDSLEKYSTFWS